MNVIEEISEEGEFTVREDVLVTGCSGVKHYFPFLLSKENDNIAVEYSDGSNIELDVAKLIIKCRDSNIHHAILVLNKEIYIDNRVSRMTEENRIRIMVDKERWTKSFQP